METANGNKGLLKKISQLCREKNEFIKRVNVLKNEKEVFEQIRKNQDNYVGDEFWYHGSK